MLVVPLGDRMKDVIARFWGFEKLIGSALVKIAYYIGLVLIVGTSVVMAVAGLVGMRAETGIGVGVFLGSLIGGVIALVFWRFACEMAILSFQTYARLGEIRDGLPHA